MRVTWNTSVPTIGVAAAGSPFSAGTNSPYNVWSPIESGFGMSHSAVISGLPTSRPTHYTVLSKDFVGNSVSAQDAVLP